MSTSRANAQRDPARTSSTFSETSSVSLQTPYGDMMPMFPCCQCGQSDETGSPVLCPVHYTLPLAVGQPAMSLVMTASTEGSVTGESAAGTDSPPLSPRDRSSSYRFTPPMSLENFPRPANINRGDSLATVLEERYQVRTKL